MKGRSLFTVAFVAASLLSSTARAQPFTSLVDAELLSPGSFAVGLFSPVRVGLHERVELRAQLASWAMLSPDVSMRVRHLHGDAVRLSSHFGLWLPTPAMRLLKGTLFPSFETSSQNVGWFLVPSAGVALSTGRRSVFSARADLAVGLLPTGNNDARPMDTYAPIELVFAPALNRFRASLHLSYDHAVLDWLRLRADFSLQGIGTPNPPRSPIYVSAGGAADLALGKRWRLSLGFAWYNYDNRAQVLERDATLGYRRVNVRSNDVYPTLDLVFLYDKR